MSVHDVYIKHIKIQNYRSLENVSITLNKGLNVIIGDNGAGKSNFLKFLDRPLIDSVPIIIFGKDNLDKSSGNLDYTLYVEYEDGADKFGISLEHHPLSTAKKDKVSKYTFKIFENGNHVRTVPERIPEKSNIKTTENRILQELVRLHLLISRTFIQFNLPKSIPYIILPGRLSFMESEFLVAEESTPYYARSYVSPVFSGFDQDIERELRGISGSEKSKTEFIREKIFSWFNQKKRENKYVTYLKKYSPISDIKLNENINVYYTGHNIIIENIVINFKINNNWVPWSYLSDGTIRLFHIITEVLFSNSNIILLEEPELGIHPNQLFKLMDFLKLQSQKKQIIISTHSPISLDVLSPDELDYIIIAKMTKKGTILNRLDAKQKAKAKAYINKVGNLSAYWLHSDLEQ